MWPGAKLFMANYSFVTFLTLISRVSYVVVGQYRYTAGQRRAFLMMLLDFVLNVARTFMMYVILNVNLFFQETVTKIIHLVQVGLVRQTADIDPSRGPSHYPDRLCFFVLLTHTRDLATKLLSIVIMSPDTFHVRSLPDTFRREQSPRKYMFRLKETLRSANYLLSGIHAIATRRSLSLPLGLMLV